MTQLSKERLEELQRQFHEEGYNDATDREVAAMVEQLLAVEGQEPVACIAKYESGAVHGTCERADPVAMEWLKRGMTLTPLYTAPPAPLAQPVHVPDEKAFYEWARSDIDLSITLESETYMWIARASWNACRAAMIQGAENGESPTTMNTAPALDSSPKIAESPSGNSPVIPDSWVACSERMPSVGELVLAYRPDAPESNDPLIKMATYV